MENEKINSTSLPLADESPVDIQPVGATTLFKKLGILDRVLSPAILVTMIIGVVTGVYAPKVREAFNTARFDDVSFAIAIGLIVMMWPILSKVQYELLPQILSSSRIWIHISLSVFLNWVVGPLTMLGLAWATLPDLPTYRTGVILVGLARCIAMVMVWNQLAKGDGDYCAILVVINSILQIILYSPYSLLFINIVGGEHVAHVRYSQVAISVLIYLGIPLVAGVITRYTVWWLTSKSFLETRFLPLFSPLAFLGLLYTIFVMFAYQGHHIVQNIGPVFRVFVPMGAYFIIMWSGSFGLMYYLNQKERIRDGKEQIFAYEEAVVQAFTAGSNNFELAIAVAIAIWGVDSDQALAATIGPLVEVPVLLALAWVALYLRGRMPWRRHVNVPENTSHKNSALSAPPA